jgi:hypothetical protein
MALYGYARVSTLDQDLSIQRAALKSAGCEVIRAEKASGARRDGRTELRVLLDFLRAGDALVVTRIDRLARSLKDLQDIVHELKARGVALKATEQPRPSSHIQRNVEWCAYRPDFGASLTFSWGAWEMARCFGSAFRMFRLSIYWIIVAKMRSFVATVARQQPAASAICS